MQIAKLIPGATTKKKENPNKNPSQGKKVEKTFQNRFFILISFLDQICIKPVFVTVNNSCAFQEQLRFLSFKLAFNSTLNVHLYEQKLERLEPTQH